jgi:DNA polymerase-3 subunit delta'
VTVLEDLIVLPWHREAIDTLASAAVRERLGHAWLLHGPAGLGKRRLAETLAVALVGGLRPRDWPAHIRADAGPAAAAPSLRPDLYRLQPAPDKRSISVDQVRELIEQLTYTSHGGGARVVIVALAEEMTISAANSLLKTLEEPPKDSYLLLVSHEPGRLPATLRSRCQRLAIRPPSPTVAAGWLTAVEGRRDWGPLLRLAQGCPLRALALAEVGLDRLDAKWCSELAALVSSGDPADVDAWLKENPAVFLAWLQGRVESLLRDLVDPQAIAADSAHAQLLAAARARPAATLFVLRDGLLRLRRMVDGGVNLALALEALLGAWRRAA